MPSCIAHVSVLRYLLHRHPSCSSCTGVFACISHGFPKFGSLLSSESLAGFSCARPVDERVDQESFVRRPGSFSFAAFTHILPLRLFFCRTIRDAAFRSLSFSGCSSLARASSIVPRADFGTARTVERVGLNAGNSWLNAVPSRAKWHRTLSSC